MLMDSVVHSAMIAVSLFLFSVAAPNVLHSVHQQFRHVYVALVMPVWYLPHASWSMSLLEALRGGGYRSAAVVYW